MAIKCSFYGQRNLGRPGCLLAKQAFGQAVGNLVGLTGTPAAWRYAANGQKKDGSASSSDFQLFLPLASRKRWQR